MIQVIKKMKSTASHKITAAKDAAANLAFRGRNLLSGNAGEGYIDTAIKILLAVVIGALLLAGLYALFGETVLPTLTQRIKEMFNYAG
ncbi:MAG: Class III signal peptide-containing protein [Oscillospiraceae bacterium]|jgi:outer membrane murein-binding lipoprotein Lpp